MDIRTCKKCKKFYDYGSRGEYKNLCPACSKIMEEKFTEVKEYIRENPQTTTAQVAEECDVSVSQIERWVREERLTFSSESSMGLPCEKCGTTIRSGKYCERCKAEVARDLTNAYAVNTPEQIKKKTKGDDKMRFIGGV